MTPVHHGPRLLSFLFGHGGRGLECVVYTGPEACETVLDPTAEQVAERLARGPAYWGADSGEATLRWCRPDPAGGEGYTILHNRPRLVILHNAADGFHLAYTGPAHPFVVAFDPTAPADRVLHYVCGNQAYFPRATFVPRKAAERVVRDFLAGGEPSPAVEWRSGAELRCGDTDN